MRVDWVKLLISKFLMLPLSSERGSLMLNVMGNSHSNFPKEKATSSKGRVYYLFLRRNIY